MTSSSAPAGAALSIPLRLQPHNPPVPFVGRDALAERLRGALLRAPVVVLWGFSGVGKSALLWHVLATSFAARRDRVLVLDARDGDPLAAAAALLGTSPDDDGADLLGGLEGRSLWLVLEQLEGLDHHPGVRALSSLMARHAQNARLVCVCREDPRDPALRPQTVAVPPLDDDALGALLDQVQPASPGEQGDVERRTLIQRAKGSPWRLLQLSMGAAHDDETGPERSLLALSPAALGLLRTLSLVPASVPLEALQRALRLPPPATIETLARRGYVEVSAHGLRLHDAALPFVRAGLPAAEEETRTQRLAQALADDDDPGLARHALRLLRRCKDAGAVTQSLVARHFYALRHDGHAGDLYEAARATPGSLDDARLRLLRLDIGVYNLNTLPDETDDDDTDHDVARGETGLRELRHRQARVLRCQGESAQALALLRAAPPWPNAGESHPGRRTLDERGRAATAVGDFEDARAAFEALAKTPAPLDALHGRVGLARLRLLQGDLKDLDNELARQIVAAGELSDSAPLRALQRRLWPCLDVLWSMEGNHDAVARATLHEGAPAALVAALDDARAALQENGDAKRALQGALAARGSARALSLLPTALEATVLALDAALIASDRAAVSTLVEQLAHESVRCESDRFALEARLVTAYAADDTAQLLELADNEDENPVVARRARALLNEEPPLHALDRRVLASLDPLRSQATLVQSASGPEWTVDEKTHHVLLSNGKSIDLSSKRVLFSLLLVLCSQDGAASKEELLEKAWGVTAYHPLQHDNRLKVAVRKLRRLLEEALGDDPIEAQDSGYRLRGRVRLVRHSPA